MSSDIKPSTKREEWEVEDDLRAVKRAMAVFKDKDRLNDVQEMIKSKKDVEAVIDAVGDGNLQEALGLMQS